MANLEDVFAENWSGWVRYVERHTHPDVAEDITSDVVCAVIEQLGQINDVAAYIHSCLDNAIVTWYRKRRNPDTLHDGISAEDMPDGALLTLSTTAQEVVKLRHIDGYSISEIADELDLTIGATRWQLELAMKELRRQWGVPHETYGTQKVRERRELISDLLHEGYSAAELAKKLNVSKRTIWRDLREIKRRD